MLQLLATALVINVTIYLAIGLAFAVPFAMRGARRIDPAASSGTVGFRLLILPGATLLWPWMLYRWSRSSGAPPEERNAHRLAARRDRST